MKQKTGPGRPHTVLKVVRAVRLPGTTVAAWEGVASTGEQVHLSFRPGELNVMVARPTLGGRSWQTVVRCNPLLIKAEEEVERWEVRERLWRTGSRPALRALRSEVNHLRHRLWVEAKGRLHLRPGWGNNSIVAKATLAMMQDWLETRETLRYRLARFGWLGGTAGVLLETAVEESRS